MQKEDRELLKTKCRLNETKCRFVFRKFDPLKIVADRRGNHMLLAPSQKEKIRNTSPIEHVAFDQRNYQKEGVGSRSNTKRKDLDFHSHLFLKNGRISYNKIVILGELNLRLNL